MNAAAIPALVVGTGFGCRIQVPALRAAGFEVVGLVGADRARTSQRAEANGVPSAFTDLEEAITRTGAAAVAISTPPDSHAPLALAAISRGCHVICEKPFAMDVAQAREMLGAARRAGIVHMVGHEFRWSPERATLARVIADGAIGEPRMANFTSFSPYLAGPKVDMPEWWFDPASGGGWLGAAGSHLVDWIRTLLGEFDSLSAAMPQIVMRGEGADDSFVFRFATAGGAEGVVQQSAATWGPPADMVRIAGTSGTAWVEGGQIHLADQSGTRVVPVSEDLQLPPVPPLSGDPRYDTPKWRMLVQVELPAYVRLCEAFRILIEGGSPPAAAPIPTFEDGLAQIEILAAVRASAANGGALVEVNRA